MGSQNPVVRSDAEATQLQDRRLTELNHAVWRHADDEQ